MGTELTTTQQPDLAVMQHTATLLANSLIVPRAYRGKPDDIFAASMLGAVHGWNPMTAMQYIHVVEGKASLSAEAMVSLVRSKGHSIDVVQLDDDGAVVRGKRADTGDVMQFEFTRQHAKDAGLLGKQVWKAYFRSMAWARVVSQLCRSLWPDVVMGQSYTPEEAHSIAGHDLAEPPPVALPIEPADDIAALPAAEPAAEPVDDGELVQGEVEQPDDGPSSDQLDELAAAIGARTDGERATIKGRMRTTGITSWAGMTGEQFDQVVGWLAELDEQPVDDAAAAVAAAQEAGGPAIRRRRNTAA